MQVQEVHQGLGSSTLLASALNIRQSSRTMVFRGGRSFERSGLHDLFSKLANQGHWCFFSDIPANPQLKTVQSALQLYRQFNPDIVIAAGGGSVVDTAKAVIALAGGGAIEEVLSGDFTPPERRPIFAAIPTTAGSGSEATHFAVLYDQGKKYSLAHDALLPNFVFLDGRATLSCSQFLTAASGADAVCQSVESYWNKYATPESRALSVQALGLLLPNLERALETPGDEVARQQLLEGAHLAGRAINITKTTAGHALSYGLTSHFGLAHGFAVLVVMKYLVPLMGSEFQSFGPATELGALDEAFASYGPSFVEGFSRFCDRLLPYAGRLLPTSTEGADLRRLEHALTAGVNVQRLGNHPNQISEDQIRSLYHSILTMP